MDNETYDMSNDNYDIDDTTDDEEEERYAQSMEINIFDMDDVVRALMKAGYEVLCSQDGESEDVVIISYIHPKYTHHRFVEDWI